MWFVSFLFNLNPPLGSIGPAGGVVVQHTVGGASGIKSAPPPGVQVQPINPGSNNTSAGNPPEIHEPSDRNFIVEAGGVVNKRRIGGAMAIASMPPPLSWDDEFEEWLLLNDFDFVQAEMDQEEHAMGSIAS